MPPNSDECFRVTLWVDSEPPYLAPGQDTFDVTDAANVVRLNPAALEPFPVSVGDLFEIVPSSTEDSSTSAPRSQHEPGFLLTIRPHTLVCQQGLQLLVPIAIARVFDLERFNRHDVILRKLPTPVPSTHCADHVELFFRDQYLGRGEMWRMMMMLVDSCAWAGREITLGTLKVKTKVGRVFIQGKRVLSGLITPYTKLIFRSESAKYYLFVQISSEMWTFEEDGSLYHEKAILFLEDLFNRWANLSTNHLVSLILFSRVFYSAKEKDHVPPPVSIYEDGRAYKDFYKVVVDLELLNHPQQVLDQVRDEILNFQKRVLTYTDSQGNRKLAGKLSYAPEGNILEAMGLACNSFDEHYIDRDLRRTAFSTVFVTAGTCVYHVNQMLLRFLAADVEPNAIRSQSSSWAIEPSLNPIYIDPPSPQSPRSVHYSVPFFVDCSFFSRHQDRPFRVDRFMPRCRVPQFQSGIGEHDLTGISIPLLSESMPPSAISDDSAARKKARQRFDAKVVDASPNPLAPLRAPGVNHRSGSLAMVDGLAVTAVETKRKSFTSKGEEINRSPLLKAALPTGTTDFSQLANQPSAELSIVPIASSETSRARAASASTTTGSITGKTGTPALIARLTNLSQQHRPFWSWSTSSNSTIIKSDTASQNAPTNRSSSPPEGSRSTRQDELKGSILGSILGQEPPMTSAQEAKDEGAHLGRSDTIRSATTLMPLINTSRRAGSSSSNHPDITESNSRNPSITPRKLKPRLVVKKFNPSNPCGSASGLLSQFRQWSAIFSRPPNGQRSVKWKSLTTPACLPITTDFAPNQKELNTSYWLTEYEFPIHESSTLVKSSDGIEESMRNRAAATLREAVSQRLSQCFQLVMPKLPQDIADLSPSARPLSVSLKGIIQEAEKGLGAHIDLSLGDHYHRLSIHSLESAKPILSVQIYVRCQNWKAEPFVCHPSIWWSNEFPGWEECKINFKFPSQDSFDFQALDRLIVGIDKGIPFSDGLKYCRLRAVVLPGQADVARDSSLVIRGKSLPVDDENRLAGMMKLQSTLRNVVWQTPIETGPTLDFTNSDASQHVRHECEKSFTHTTTGRDQRERSNHTLSLRDPPSAMVQAMLHPSSGIEFKSQLIQLRLMENLFHGDQFVSFLKNQLNFGTREEALNFGRQLEAKGLFREITNGNQPRPLIDGSRCYQLNSEYRPVKPPRTWFGRTTTEKSTTTNSNTKPMSNPVMIGSSAGERRRSSSTSGAQGERTAANMTRIGMIDLDPNGKSDRSEKAILHCDISHSPSNAWHVEVHWLGVTSSLVDNMLQNWARIVERYGMKIVEQSTRSMEHFSDCNPFQKTIRIDLAFKPPSPEGIESLIPIFTSPNYYFEGQLFRSQGFVLDVEADHNFPSDVHVVYSYRRHSYQYPQFIHHSGAAIVQVRDGYLIWADNLPARISVNNRRLAGGRPESNSTGIDSTALRKSFTELCNDKTRLKSFWDLCLNNLREASESNPKQPE